MKLQCSCGAKYAFDITPEMLQNPVKFVCPSCGLDSSDYVNQLVREELAQQIVPDEPLPSVAPVPPPAARLKISHEEKPAAPTPEIFVSSKFCSKHPRERATEKCAVCEKPICPKCLELFGYFCSPLCKGKAEAKNIKAPVYARKNFEGEAQFWHKTGLIFSVLIVLVILALAGWTWYAWFGAVPHPIFSVRFDQISHSGASQLAGKDQIVFLHGGTLAHYDLKNKKPVWSLELVTPTQIADGVKRENDLRARENAADDSAYHQNLPAGGLEKMVRLGLESGLSLHVAGQNIWIGSGNKLTHYDWDSGRILREISLPEFGGDLVQSGDELQVLGAQYVTHISLASGDMRAEKFPAPSAMVVASAKNSIGSAGNNASSGLPISNANNGQPLDPNKVEAQAQNLKLPARIALPALLANENHEQQLEAAMRDDSPHSHSPIANQLRQNAENFRLIPGVNGFVQFSAKLLEEHLVTRAAMKAAPAKSALDGDVNASKTSEIANETLNEMQRNNGGDTVTEDESRYQVTVHLPGSNAADWTGEVVGLPQLLALKTVNVIAAGKTIIVLDQSNKKLWQTELTYNVASSNGEMESQFGAGPCVEHGDTLFVFDQAVLAAFDLTGGGARWRLPSVGVVGLFFDDQNNLYVNTTTGNPDDIKYSRQIDINKSTDAVVLKIDSKTGKTLWSIKPGGFISYLSGKFIYTLESYDPGDKEDELSDTLAGLQKPAFLRLIRLNPKNGNFLWVYQDDRAPMNVKFQNNIIEFIFKREVQVLRYLTF